MRPWLQTIEYNYAALAFFAVVIAVSSISYLGFEKPLNKLIRNKFGQSPTTVPAQVGEERVAVAV